MAGDFKPSKEFAEFFFRAIDQGFNAIADSTGPMFPFTFTASETDPITTTVFAGSESAECIEGARKSVDAQRGKLTLYAIAWDGYLTIGDTRTEAIYVEAGQVDEADGVLFCQRYTPLKKRFLRRGHRERIGNPMLLRRVPSRIWRGEES